MQIRAYDERDLEELKRIHGAQAFGYAFPDLSNPLFLTKLVLVGEKARREPCLDGALRGDRGAPGEEPEKGIVGAALLRVTAEAYLLLDPKAGTPRERWEWLLGLHATAERDAAARGLEDVHAWLPPEIAAKFGRRLARLGWIRDDRWTPYCKRLG
ncbi:MAG TPA: hypothetical protein VMH31_15680 [Methylomirabilota bacterium]|nr:hypothetical protein [Methylomirabilota bacterium]